MPKISLGWNIEWNEPIRLTALTMRLYEEHKGKIELQEVLRARNDEVVTAICGPRYHPEANARYTRAGNKKRILGTRFGKVEIKASRVRDKLTGRTEIPLWADVLIDKRRIYQEDISSLAEQFSTKLTYRDTVKELGKVIPEVPSARTINRRVMEDGAVLSKQIQERELKATTLQPDGTKLHSQEGGNRDVNMVIATNGGKEPRLRSLTVGKGWEEHLDALSRTMFCNRFNEPVPPTVVSDMERGLAELITPDGGYWQPCIPHVYRGFAYALWGDGLRHGDEKKGYIRTVVNIVQHLLNSVRCHLPKGEMEELTQRIIQTTKELRRLATLLLADNYYKAAGFLREISANITTFATLAMQGIIVPWHNNLVERIMGEVSKRCKHKWMSWTDRGSQALLTILIIETVEPDTFDAFWSRKLYGDAPYTPNLGVDISPFRSGI